MIKEIFKLLSILFCFNSFGANLPSRAEFIGNVFPHSSIFRDNIHGLYALICGVSNLPTVDLHEHFTKCDACKRKLNDSASCRYCKKIFLENCNSGEMDNHFSMCNYAKSNSFAEPVTKHDTELDLIASRSFIPIRPMTSLSIFTAGSSEISLCTDSMSTLGNTVSEVAVQYPQVTPESEEVSSFISDEILNQELQQSDMDISSCLLPRSVIFVNREDGHISPIYCNPYDYIRDEMKNKVIMQHQNDKFLLDGTLTYIDESSDEEIALMWRQEQLLEQLFGDNNG